jgi:hypothetical protein
MRVVNINIINYLAKKLKMWDCHLRGVVNNTQGTLSQILV